MKKQAAVTAAGVLVAAGLVATGVSQTAYETPQASVSEARSVLEDQAAIPGTSWAVDPDSGDLVVTADKTVEGKDLDKLKDVVDDLGDKVELEESNTVMRTYVPGGDAILSSERCSAGFNVLIAGNPFMVTAGHCGKKGSVWKDKSGNQIGTMVESVFPGDDYALVKYDSTEKPANTVNLYNGTNQIFTIGKPSLGQQVERSGSTTGVQKGRITGLNATVNYGNGISVDGLVQTDICAEPGDSGGPLFSGGMALGILSGGYGNCRSGGTTFYQPLNDLVGKYNLTLP